MEFKLGEHSPQGVLHSTVELLFGRRQLSPPIVYRDEALSVMSVTLEASAG
jgi:hypothetical protein